MEAELYPTAARYRGSEPVPGLATKAHADLALDLRQTDCYTGPSGLFVQGGAGCDPAPPPASPNRSSFSLNTAVMAVGEGNYGRLGRDQQQRYTTDNRELMLPDPDEQPGALPEIGPSPDLTRNIDRPSTSAPWSCRPGASTGCCGRWCTSSSACDPTSASAAWRWCRSYRRARAASPAPTSGRRRLARRLGDPRGQAVHHHGPLLGSLQTADRAYHPR
jgi:hypothetical protein